MITIHAEGTFASLRYSLGGDHPSQTTHHTMSPPKQVRFQLDKGWYFTNDSASPDDDTSKSPTYPTHYITKTNVKL